MKAPQLREAAILAVVGLADALAALSTYVQEGPTLDEFPEPIGPLLEALVRSAEFCREACEAHVSNFGDEVDAFGQMIAAAQKFLSDWNS